MTLVAGGQREISHPAGDELEHRSRREGAAGVALVLARVLLGEVAFRSHFVPQELVRPHGLLGGLDGAEGLLPPSGAPPRVEEPPFSVGEEEDLRHAVVQRFALLSPQALDDVVEPLHDRGGEAGVVIEREAEQHAFDATRVEQSAEDAALVARVTSCAVEVRDQVEIPLGQLLELRGQDVARELAVGLLSAASAGEEDRERVRLATIELLAQPQRAVGREHDRRQRAGHENGVVTAVLLLARTTLAADDHGPRCRALLDLLHEEPDSVAHGRARDAQIVDEVAVAGSPCLLHDLGPVAHALREEVGAQLVRGLKLSLGN